jgi:hypothetical protein
MKYSFIEFSIKELVELIDKDKVDLNPSYQRNFIWSSIDQKDLIDSIIQEFPLPNFFIYKKPDGQYEMVDGQQRSKTIYRFVKGQISSSKKIGSINFEGSDTEKILNYKLPVVLIEELANGEFLKDFYVLINKKGVHLNVPEVNKSEFHDTLFLKLANEVLTYQNLIELDLFSEATSKRMNDRAYIEELLGYLRVGIKDKKKSVTDIYKNDDISEEEFQILKTKFEKTIDIIACFQKIKPINQTRYKQKNDFFTLFNFIDENCNEDIKTLEYQYKILVALDGKDNEGRQYIRPTNESCIALKDYAYHCVTQSNSKNARDSRLLFFNSILKNKDIENNKILTSVLDYFDDVLNLDVDLLTFNEYELLDVKVFNI